jgi:hypothetical protein
MKTHIGDRFVFLVVYKDTFDVTITESWGILEVYAWRTSDNKGLGYLLYYLDEVFAA